MTKKFQLIFDIWLHLFLRKCPKGGFHLGILTQMFIIFQAVHSHEEGIT